MNILFDIGHPGQVHLYRHAIRILRENGHKIIVTVKNIPSAKNLLEAFQIEYISLGKKYDSILLKGLTQLKYNFNLYQIARKEKIDIAVGSSITITHVSVFHKMKSIVLDDDDAEAVLLFSLFAHPFADCIISPAALAHQRKRKKDITYKGTHELFYLHPAYFSPNSAVLAEAGINETDTFFLLRFVSGKAYHDSGHNWLNLEQKLQIISLLEPYGKVFITTEREIEHELQKWQLKIPPEKIHHLMYFAEMFIGDSQTMTSEAAILGTPALKCNTFAHRLSVPNQLENQYDLCYAFQPEEFYLMIEKIKLLLTRQDLKKSWKLKKEAFLFDCINPTKFLTWFIENYPKSIQQVKNDSDFINKFH